MLVLLPRSGQNARPAVVIDDYLFDSLKLIVHGADPALEHLYPVLAMLIVGEEDEIAVPWENFDRDLAGT